MALKCGIVGLPNVGKSTLFNALTSAKALAANYPFATKEPNIGVITVPDPRLDKLAELVNPQKIQPTTVDIVDIAGLIWATSGRPMPSSTLYAVLTTTMSYPVRDKMIIDTELILKDIETVEKKVDKFRRTAKSGDKESKKMVEIGDALLAHLEGEQPARSFETTEEGEEIVSDLYLLTAKPILYVCNVDEDSFPDGNKHTEAFKTEAAKEKAEVILVSAQIEAEIAELDTKEERLEFLEEMGLEEAGVNRVIRASYSLLKLRTYFTAGEKEVRAWTIVEGTKAPGAAGVIHTDFEKGFIRAEVIHYPDYVEYGSESGARDAGKLGVEGKEYVVQDGDVMHFRFNV